MAKLILFGPNGPEDFQLGDVLTIGRRSSNTLRLREEFVSRDHLKISKTADGYVLEDVSSKDGVGVIINNVKLKGVTGKNPWHKLRHNDVILINDIQLAFDDPVADPDAVPTMVPAAILEKLKAYENKIVKPAAPPVPVAPPAKPTPQAALKPAPVVPAALKSAEKGSAIPIAKPSNKRTSIQIKQADIETQERKPDPVAPKISIAPTIRKEESDGDSLSVNKSISDYIPERYMVKQAGDSDAPKKASRTIHLMLAACIVLMLGLLSGVAWIFMDPIHLQWVQQRLGLKNTPAEVKAALAAGKVEEAEKLLKDNQDRMSSTDRAGIKMAIETHKRAKLLDEIRADIATNRFDEARRLAQTELSTKGRDGQDEFYLLSDFASSALNVTKFYESSQGADKTVDLIRLQDIDANLHDALDEFARNKQKVDDFKKTAVGADGKALIEPMDLTSKPELLTIRDAVEPLKKRVVQRIALVQSAEKVWNEVNAAQKAGDFDKEKTVLETLSKIPPDIVEKISKGQSADALQSNLNHFVAGINASKARQFKLAAEELAQVAKDDAHHAAADTALAEVSRQAKLDDARVTYAQGNVEDAQAKLAAMQDDPDAREFRDHIAKIVQGWEAVKSAKASRISDQIIRQASALLGMLDTRDAWFRSQGEAALIEAKRNVGMLKLARLRQMIDERKFETARPELEKVLADIDRATLQDLYDEALKLKSKMEDAISERTTTAYNDASTAWQTYQRERLTTLDLASADEAHVATVARQTKALNEMWLKIRDARETVDNAKPELRAPIKVLYEQFVAEILHYSEKLDGAIKVGTITGRADYIKMAQERLLSLPPVPNNKWADAAKANSK